MSNLCYASTNCIHINNRIKMMRTNDKKNKLQIYHENLKQKHSFLQTKLAPQ